jgi:hypothetical protein
MHVYKEKGPGEKPVLYIESLHKFQGVAVQCFCQEESC